MEAIGLTASLIAILELCGKTILYIQTAKGGSKQKAQLMTEIQSLQLVTGQLHDVSDDDGWKRTMEILAEPGAPLKLLEETLRSLVQKLGSNAGLRRGLDVVLWPFQEKEVNSILAMIERQKASLSLALENNSRLLQDRIASQVNSNHDSLEELKTICGGLHDEINTVKRSLEQSRVRETLQWMTKLNFGPRHDTILQSWDRKSGTGTWILRHPLFIEWTASKTTETKLWCYGIPGAGKSVIAAIIFDHLRESLKPSNQYVSVATLYCDHEQQADQNLDELERSILHRALADCVTLPAALQDLRNETKDGFSPSLVKLHSVIASSPAASQTLFVVLDALDEASEIVQDQLVDRISALPFRDVRVLCTSRTWPKFEETFAGSPQIEVSASDNDVEHFVLKKIEDVSRLRKFMGESTTLRDQVVTKVLEKAKGSFLMAKHHMDELSSANTRKQLLKKLEKLPEKMQDAYDLTMKRIRQQPSSDKTLAERTLSLVFGAHTQLNLWEIQHALATLTLYKYDRDDEEDEPDGIEEDDLPSADTIVQCCQGLLIVEYGDSEWFFPGIRASHYTAMLLATACCYYLTLPSLQNAFKDKPQFGKFPPDFPLEPYASDHWGVHFFEARSESPISLRSHVEGALQHGWTRLKELAGMSRYDTETVRDILAPFRVLRVIDQWGGDVNAVDGKGESLLYSAVANGDIYAAKFLLKLPSLEIDPMSPYFDRLLKLAVRTLWADLIQHLVKVLALDKRLVRRRDGALSERLRKVQNDVIAEFHNHSVEKHDFFKVDDLFGFFDTVLRTLQKFDPQDDRMLLINLISALDYVAEDQFELIRFFCDHDLRLKATDADGNNILHLAAKLVHDDATSFLLEQGLSPDLVNVQGKSPAQVAIDNNNFRVFLQLLSAMSVSARCQLTDTRQAAIANSHIERPEDDGFSILLSEAKTGHFGSAIDARKRTALMWVVSEGRLNTAEKLECINLLLDLGTDISSQDDNGMTALSYLTAGPSAWSINLYDELLAAGVDQNAQDCKAMAPIHHIVFQRPWVPSGQLSLIVELLLDKGANAGDKDSSGISAVGHLIHSGGYADDDALEAAQILANEYGELGPTYPTLENTFVASDQKTSRWAEVDIKPTLATLWLLLGNEALDTVSLFGLKVENTTGYKATLRLTELVKSEKDALEECYQSDKPLEWLGRTQIDRRIKEEIGELLNLAGMELTSPSSYEGSDTSSCEST
ncbi:hypothetical protein CkaCkLH20_06144 [Colletotrichum karsti]|uniref:Nephrocystin 3-like N-terminal domain-containing protein n=1 Tax=Colletotrichum karsti TaxID=1095194 RepID=A0A9P6I937_9PEZI|nr:uncharacterized protein CkaCkLH20_06144 [Colletotrichum karsti]KAF9876201.1 hypothetical protein CkaCkLH20_06144 [Colletotrichum karsti]